MACLGSGIQPIRPQEITLVFPNALVRMLAEDVHALVCRRTPSSFVYEDDGGGGWGGIGTSASVVPPAAHKWVLPKGVGRY